MKQQKSHTAETLPNPTRASAPRWIELPSFPGASGTLSYCQAKEMLPFAIKRIFYIHDISPKAVRGGHAHHTTQEVVICLSGACRLKAYAADGTAAVFNLAEPNRGVYLPAMWWVELEDFSPQAIVLVLASTDYSPDDYIREPESFFHDLPYPISKSCR